MIDMNAVYFKGHWGDDKRGRCIGVPRGCGVQGGRHVRECGYLLRVSAHSEAVRVRITVSLIKKADSFYDSARVACAANVRIKRKL